MTPYRVTIHCSATNNGERLDISVIDQWHRDRGWTGVGYHMVIQPDGEVQNGRPLNVQGAHVEGENKGNIGICLIGTSKFKSRQIDSLRSRLDSVLMMYSIKPWEIWAHNQFQSAIKQGKVCPGIPINSILAWYIGHHEKALEPYMI